MSAMDRRYFVVTAPISDARLVIGHTPSNTYFGSSMAYGKVFLFGTLSEGTIIADVPGGLFVTEIERVPLLMPLRIGAGKHPFEKVYLPSRPIERIDVNAYDEISTADAAQWGTDSINWAGKIDLGNLTHEWIEAAGGRIDANMFDWVIPLDISNPEAIINATEQGRATV